MRNPAASSSPSSLIDRPAAERPAAERPGERPAGERYEVLRRLGSGGNVELFIAWDREGAREVTLQRLRGDDRDDHGVLVRHTTGRTLERVIAVRGPLLPDSALRIVTDVVDALVDHHARGLAHRPTAAANVLVDETDHALLLDLEEPRECGGCRHEVSDVDDVGRLALHIVLGCTPPADPRTLRDLARRIFAPALAAVIARAVAPRGERFARLADFATALRAAIASTTATTTATTTAATTAATIEVHDTVEMPPLSIRPDPMIEDVVSLRVAAGASVGHVAAGTLRQFAFGCAVVLVGVFAAVASTSDWIATDGTAATAFETPAPLREMAPTPRIVPTETAEIDFEASPEDLAAAAARHR